MGGKTRKFIVTFIEWILLEKEMEGNAGIDFIVSICG